MKLRILPTFSAFATLTLFSCYPYPEQPPGGPTTKPGTNTSVSDPENQKVEQQRDRMKKAAEEKKLQAEQETTPGSDLPKPAERKPATYDTAQPVPGKEGFVFSPYNNKVIDVRDMPSGQLVADPTYPASEKKYFRVP